MSDRDKKNVALLTDTIDKDEWEFGHSNVVEAASRNRMRCRIANRAVNRLSDLLEEPLCCWGGFGEIPCLGLSQFSECLCVELNHCCKSARS